MELHLAILSEKQEEVHYIWELTKIGLKNKFEVVSIGFEIFIAKQFLNKVQNYFFLKVNPPTFVAIQNQSN